jgi:hypothetical protein
LTFSIIPVTVVPSIFVNEAMFPSLIMFILSFALYTYLYHIRKAMSRVNYIIYRYNQMMRK